MLEALKIALWILPINFYKTRHLKLCMKKNVKLTKHNGSKQAFLFIKNYVYCFA